MTAPDFWTDDNIARLRRLWADDQLSSSTIALRLGTTKNAVVGKAHRLGLPSRPSPIKPASEPRPRPMFRPKVTLPGPAADAPAPPPVPAQPAFALRRTCCWPEWPDGARPTHVYCDAPIPLRDAEAPRPYCDAHWARSRATHVAYYLRDKAVGLSGNSARRLVGAA